MTVGGALLLLAAAGLSTAPVPIFAYRQSKDMGTLDMAAQRRANNLHKLDTTILLTYVTVMVVIVLTSWLFKHYRFRFVHETGLQLLYGLMIGFVLRYFNIGLLQSQTMDVELVGSTKTVLSEPPDYLRLEVRESNETPSVRFHYELIEGFNADSKKQNTQQQEQKSAFSPEVFFNMLLPPIIFNAGYSLKKRHFFRNIGSILAFVFLGTTISCLVTGFLMYIFTAIFGMGFTFQELLFFGALISATDPVTVLAVFTEMNVESDLFALVFGESAMNDAVAIVLSSTIDQFSYGSGETLTLGAIFHAGMNFFYVFLGSLLLGSSIGCSTALLTKFTLIQDHPLLESSMFILLSYISFLLSEVVGLTGIVAVLFCGICQAHYTYNNLSTESQTRTKQFFEMISFLSESFIFCYIGVSVFVSDSHKWSFFFLIFALFSVVIARACHVYPLSAILNTHRRPRISTAYQHMLVFSGLRGAMAFALATRNTSTVNRQIISSTTAAVVILTVFVNGGLTTWMIERLGIKYGDANREPPKEESTSAATTPSGSNPWDKAFLPRKWYNFDANFMKPLLTHATPSLVATMPAVCEPLTRIFTSPRQMEPYYEQGDSATDSLTNSSPFNSTLSIPHTRTNDSNGVV